jgi:3-isopropylmalate/(R)-2-methylmalate dehydratase small subunit
MKYEGNIFRYGANIDTDIIIPGKFLITTDPKRLGPHCMEGLDPDFSKKVGLGDMLFVEENFGCGSSREHAPISIKAAGVSCVVAKGFARIFFRNAINIGLPILICPDAVDASSTGSRGKVDTETGSINVDGKLFAADPFPEFITNIISKGGLMEYVKSRIGEGSST